MNSQCLTFLIALEDCMVSFSFKMLAIDSTKKTMRVQQNMPIGQICSSPTGQKPWVRMRREAGTEPGTLQCSSKLLHKRAREKVYQAKASAANHHSLSSIPRIYMGEGKKSLPVVLTSTNMLWIHTHTVKFLHMPLEVKLPIRAIKKWTLKHQCCQFSRSRSSPGWVLTSAMSSWDTPSI